MDRQRVAIRVSVASIVVNLLLSAAKLAAGIIAHSGALVSDAAHSASDVLSTVIVLIGIRLAGKASDQDHPYGHERLECVASLLLAVLLFATGIAVGYNGLTRLTAGAAVVPGRLALYAAAVSILVKEALFRYTRAAARRIDSGALMADAWHHRSDALSSVGSFAGVLGARLGVPALDPFAGIVICLLIVKAAWDIYRDAVARLTDRACDGDVEQRIRETARRQKGVLGIDKMKTRLFGNKIYVDIEICADADETLAKAHDTAQQTHDAIEALFPQVKHCMVHVNPARLHSGSEQEAG